MGNDGIYGLGKDLVKQSTTFCQIESFAGPSQVDLTRETVTKNPVWHDSSSSSRVFYTWFFSLVASCEIIASQL